MRISRRVSVTLATALVMMTLGGCGGSSATSSASPASAATNVAVVIHNFAFVPASLIVKVGTTVTWMNEDPVPTDHTATAYNGAFNTGPIPPGSHAAFTFTEPGTYDYHCDFHQFMLGVIVVR